MRKTKKNKILKGKAIAGTHVVLLAWDLVSTKASLLNTIMGFSIERAEYKNGKVIEKYYLRGMKRFKNKDKGLPPGTLVYTSEHPVQTFQWGDYTAKPGTEYEYTITPVYGTVKNLFYNENEQLKIRITTESETDKPSANNSQHDIFFNRGVIGSQAYAREFNNKDPEADNPFSPEMKWLSRGLYEALINFINRAKNEKFGLRAALYEFHYQPVANAFAKAYQAGADVKIVYDAESSYKTENESTIEKSGLNEPDVIFPRTVSEGIRHNKFIVLLEKKGNKEKPVGVWTGSTNISDGGIFGHSNVGHIVWDADIAQAYLEYWERLKDNLTPGKMREPNRISTPLPAAKPPKGTLPLFSPRDDKDSNETLAWYAERMAEAKKMICFTVAFNLDEVFQDIISQNNSVLRYIVKDDDLGENEIIGHDKDVLFAAGSYLGGKTLANFKSERSNPLNSNDYIHTKFMLIDPLSNDPLVITGSANFSRPSQRSNDENMLVIRGNTRVADIYLGEFMRIFDHHYARYLARKFSNTDNLNVDTGYLKENPKDWIHSHFEKDGYKTKRRKYFSA